MRATRGRPFLLSLRLGAEIGVPAPTHVKMNEAVKRVERGEVKASPDVIRGI
jgi:hypothetical protein